MILDQVAALNFARQSANTSNQTYDIWQRQSGEYVIMARGMASLAKSFLQPNEQLTHIRVVNPNEETE